MKRTIQLAAAALLMGTGAMLGQSIISEGTYAQNFNTVGSGLPANWTVRTGAGATALGTAASLTTGATSWGDSAGAFKNVAAATGLTSTSSTGDQSGSANRALGLRQSGSVGDPGASFNFYFSTEDVIVTQITVDLMMLSVQARSTTFTLQYGIGATPASWTNLGTYTDPGSFGTTGYVFTTTDFGTALNDQSSAWFRVVALSDSTGSGSRDTVAIDNFSLTATAVPEPTGAALLGLAGAAVMLVRRRRRA